MQKDPSSTDYAATDHVVDEPFQVPTKRLKDLIAAKLAPIPRRFRKYRTYPDGTTRMHPFARERAAKRKASAAQSARDRRG